MIWWIDDEPERLKGIARSRIERPSDEALRKRRSAVVAPKELASDEQSSQLYAELIDAKKEDRLPDLLVIDQILNRKEGVLRRGSTLAVSFRAQAPTVPAVGVTAASFSEVADLQKDQFLEFFCIDDLQSGSRIPDLYAIADGFRALVSADLRSIQASKQCRTLLRLLKSPVQDREFLSTCIPGEFLQKWDDETPHKFARWIWHTMMDRPGFLHDDLEIATLLGLRVEGFERIAGRFQRCEYRGIFSSPARRRWWVTQVTARAREITRADVTQPLWELGRRILTERYQDEFSRCHGRPGKNCVPDGVAFRDELQRERVQARMDDTLPLTTDTPPVGFEQQRVFRGK